jgi:hypothetical protein
LAFQLMLFSWATATFNIIIMLIKDKKARKRICIVKI